MNVAAWYWFVMRVAVAWVLDAREYARAARMEGTK